MTFPRPRSEYPGTGFLEPMVSHAQNFEDVTLRRAFPDIKAGFWIDVGAHDPVFHSVTKWFSDTGWRGINIEPVPTLFRRFTDQRRNDINLWRAISDVDDQQIELHVIGDTGLTTTIKDMALRSKRDFETIMVPASTLNTVCETHAGSQIDFLKIDVEGAEAKVIGPFDLARFRPRVIIVENNPDIGECEEKLLANGYIYAWFDTLNRWYVRVEDAFRCDLIARPPSVWDNITISR